MFGDIFDIVTAPIKIAANVTKAVVEPIASEIVAPALEIVGEAVEEVAEVANDLVEGSKDIL